MVCTPFRDYKQNFTKPFQTHYVKKGEIYFFGRIFPMAAEAEVYNILNQDDLVDYLYRARRSEGIKHRLIFGTLLTSLD